MFTQMSNKNTLPPQAVHVRGRERANVHIHEIIRNAPTY